MTRATSSRFALASDSEAIASILRALREEGPDVGLPDNLDAERVREWISRLGDQGCMIVEFDGSILVAFAALDFSTTEPDTGLLGVWVLPQYQRRGIATDLAEQLLDFAREHGYRSIRGRLPDGNKPALSFLSSIGAMVPLRNPNMRFELPL
ncbi:MAG TPA: GNAT family N-acetyltransferase [Dehalococcoidia bacterium]|nr:GNAT family N-acetyltransferase [Dehalococcoidia bacterium]